MVNGLDLAILLATWGGPNVIADFNDDGVVNGADLGFLISSWGVCIGCPEDLNFDGIVNGSDLGLFIAAWTG